MSKHVALEKIPLFEKTKWLVLTDKILFPLQIIRKVIAIDTIHRIYNLGMSATKMDKRSQKVISYLK